MAVGAVAYMGFVGWQGWRLLTSGDLVAAVLGAVVLVLPLLGVWMVWREMAFAAKVQRLADRLAEVGGLPEELPRTPGGRVVPAAAEAEFDRCQSAVSVSPRDAQAWFQLSLAYEAARDRKRARAAMRYAVALDEGTAPPEPPARLLPTGG